MGRPSKPLLDRERITTTALELVDAEGDFSVPKIARRLGVQTGSVYHHVDGRDGIVELLRERVAVAIDPAPLTADAQPWDRRMADWARSYRAAFAAHPKAIPLLTTSPVRAPRVLEQYDLAAGLLLEAGFSLPDVMPVIIGLENVVLGSALDMAAPEMMWELTDETATPHLAAALAAMGKGRADAAFELALTGLLSHARSLLLP
ncbi:TetR/AcrR family transcriptional regulator C-terminal domain-containing protein [Streptomyces sp. NBC_00687]|uniref:TetR/AcrR family transcriptional regulator C-terminal domain-containing protein n=1 Tax=Streptomyces sp. NBC_00687 TaxID=2975807 RepID=UPI00225A7CCD|nr:TetR/AcrR family transcriptional regulator C-terminal domain-containing protein [Streptomyces sp. NBC_00687]MCX4912202.1 TetR/AcrR family transcriptional regulator C-terminal domain-containing protein [Streptomyces sp. NBC_00687]